MSKPCCSDLDSLIERAYEVMGKTYERSAKLSTKKRKNLPDSAFCGPGRSFPVNDCAHYTAALRLLNRSKYSDSTKANIRACIMRKGKKMGCSGAKKEKSETSSYLTKPILKLCEEVPEFTLTKQLVDASIEDPGKDIEFYIAKLNK